MKKTFFTVLTFSLLALGLQTARAGDREWALAGKVLTGVAAAAVISQVVYPGPVYASYSYAPAPYSCPAPVVYRYAPRPVVVYAPAPRAVVYRAPVVIARPPVVSFRFAVGGGAHHRRRGCW